MEVAGSAVEVKAPPPARHERGCGLAPARSHEWRSRATSFYTSRKAVRRHRAGDYEAEPWRELDALPEGAELDALV